MPFGAASGKTVPEDAESSPLPRRRYVEVSSQTISPSAVTTVRNS